MKLDEIKKSISATLYKRATSPLYGTFIIAWLVWNWKILIVLFFTSAVELKGVNKFEYIESNLLNAFNGILWPVVSTAVIILVLPFISIGSYWVWLKFEAWKKNLKVEIEKKKLLTLEQSIKLRTDLANTEQQFENLLKDKEEAIKTKDFIIKELQEEIEKIKKEDNEVFLDRNSEGIGASGVGGNEKEEMKTFFNFKIVQDFFEPLIENIQGDVGLPSSNIPIEMVGMCESYELIKKGQDRFYRWTEKGNRFVKEYYTNVLPSFETDVEVEN